MRNKKAADVEKKEKEIEEPKIESILDDVPEVDVSQYDNLEEVIEQVMAYATACQIKVVKRLMNKAGKISADDDYKLTQIQKILKQLQATHKMAVEMGTIKPNANGDVEANKDFMKRVRERIGLPSIVTNMSV